MNEGRASFSIRTPRWSVSLDRPFVLNVDRLVQVASLASFAVAIEVAVADSTRCRGCAVGPVPIVIDQETVLKVDPCRIVLLEIIEDRLMAVATFQFMTAARIEQVAKVAFIVDERNVLPD